MGSHCVSSVYTVVLKPKYNIKIMQDGLMGEVKRRSVDIIKNEKNTL
jgi:hypothetical protein